MNLRHRIAALEAAIRPENPFAAIPIVFLDVPGASDVIVANGQLVPCENGREIVAKHPGPVTVVGGIDPYVVAGLRPMTDQTPSANSRHRGAE